jgi:hypothetical protein
MFYEGSKIIFRVCLTLVKRNQASILQCNDFSSLAECFKETTRDSLVIKCHEFMQVMVVFIYCMYFTYGIVFVCAWARTGHLSDCRDTWYEHANKALISIVLFPAINNTNR